MANRVPDLETLADEVAAARRAGSRLTPFTSRFEGFDLPTAYRVAGILACRRAAHSAVIGRKIGFTNTSLWEAAGLAEPTWGSMYGDTVIRSGEADGVPTLSMAGTVEAKIECEVVLTLASAPPAGARGAAAARHVEEVGLGFEVVDSPYPGWDMRPADVVAAGGIHHGLAVGPLTPAGDPEELSRTLAALTVSMTRNGAHSADGSGSLVMGNPLDALGALAKMAADQGNPLRAGEIVTTGTLTPPLACAAGETYRAEAAGGVLAPVSVALTR